MGMMVFAGFATFFAGLLTFVICFANGMRSSPGQFIGRDLIAIAWMVVVILWLIATSPGHAHDHARPDLDGWYTAQASRKGPCCGGPDTDARVLTDVDWETKSGHYRVRIDGDWHDVPDESVLPGPNLDGRTLVWPIKGWGGLSIRCFIPGSMT